MPTVITNIDILYYEPRDYERARGQYFDAEEWVEDHGQGDLGIYYPPLVEDYVRVCHFDSVAELKRVLAEAGITRRFDKADALPEIIFSALNADADRTKILGCRTHESRNTPGERRGIRSMSVNDVIAMTVDGVRKCFIVKDMGFGELPAGWETAPLDTTKPLSHGIVGQCQDISEKDRGDSAWRRFVYGKVTNDWPHELLKRRTGHAKPYSKDEVTTTTNWVMGQITTNACLDDRDKKDILDFIDEYAR